MLASRIRDERGLDLIELRIAVGILVFFALVGIIAVKFPGAPAHWAIGLTGALVGALLLSTAARIASESLTEGRVARAIEDLENGEPRAEAEVRALTGDARTRWAVTPHVERLVRLLDRGPDRVAALRLLLHASPWRDVSIDGQLRALAGEIPEDLAVAALTAAKDRELRLDLVRVLVPRASDAATRRGLLGELFSRYHVPSSWPPDPPPDAWVSLLAQHEDDLRHATITEAVDQALLAVYCDTVAKAKGEASGKPPAAV